MAGKTSAASSKALRRTGLGGRWRLEGRGCDGETIAVVARVPGVVHWDLQRAGVIRDPFQADNEKSVQWVAERDWTYLRTFTVGEETAAARHLELVFDGLDTFAQIALNGKRIATTDNMFVPHRIDITGLLKPGGNRLAVKFLSPLKEGLKLHRKHRQVRLYEGPDNPRAYVRKAQYSFGWDWGPRIATSGIWRDAYIEAWDAGRIERVQWRTLRISGKSAEVAVTVDAVGGGPLAAEARLSIDAKTLPVRLARRKTKNGFQFAGTVSLRNPRLWWPAGHGKQDMYTASVVLRSRGAEVDRRVEKIGIRTVDLRRERDREGESFIIAVNGREIFCKGANWIPADSYLPRLTAKDYREWVKLAADANMNMLRVWGGGIYETEEFYGACDRYGIMVWQDFPFACAMYPEGEWFVENVRREAARAVEALRNHPSLVLWCGNNENHWAAHSWWPTDPFGGETIYNRVLPALVRKLDPSRPYWPGSPYGGKDPNSAARGDRHSWDVWSGWRDFAEYLSDNGRFISEFGFQAPPPMESVAEFGPLEELHPQHPLFEHHNKQVGGPERLARFLAAVFPPARDLEEFVYLTQLVQAEAIKTGVLHWRSRQMATAGALYWQLNDCWPVASWSAADYRRRPKALWYYTRRFFAPVAVRVAELKDGISAWVVNDSPKAVAGRLSLEVMTFDGGGRRAIEKAVRIAPNGVFRFGPFSRGDLVIEDPAREFIAASFKPRRGGPVRDEAFLLRPKHLCLGDPSLKWKVTGDARRLKVEINAKRLAYGVFLRLPGTEARFSDNFFTLLPGEKRTVSIEGADLGARDAAGRLRVHWVHGGAY